MTGTPFRALQCPQLFMPTLTLFICDMVVLAAAKRVRSTHACVRKGCNLLQMYSAE